MGIFSWLFSKQDPPLYIDGNGKYEFDIVGESNYQKALHAIAGPRTEDGARHKCQAVIIPEPLNKHDKNAVAVFIDRKKVGYLSRADAKSWNADLKAKGKSRSPVIASAIIVGGWLRDSQDQGHYGVKLDI
ncbi:hypothetical protein [Celeribacter sp.]|uniref:hypothetical protein n=1 Tax=Celeribacter sp. TaxID=1890673 RepID=UPI003A95937E